MVMKFIKPEDEVLVKEIECYINKIKKQLSVNMATKICYTECGNRIKKQP